MCFTSATRAQTAASVARAPPRLCPVQMILQDRTGIMSEAGKFCQANGVTNPASSGI